MFGDRHTVAVPTLEDPQNPLPDESDPFEGLVLDEDFVRGAKKQEGSARARMLAAKWKQEPPADTSFRPKPTGGRRWYQRKPKPYQVQAQRKRRRLGRLQAPLFVLIAVGLVLVAMNPAAAHTWLDKHFGGGSGSSASGPGLVLTPSASPGSGSDSDPDSPTVAHPFAGSPAAAWADGAAGIVAPAPHAVGVFSASQVSGDLKEVKAYLADAYLDPANLAGAYPHNVVNALQHSEAESLSQALAQPSYSNDPTTWVVRFDQSSAVLASPTVKVQGTFGISGDGHNGLMVKTDYVFVYALREGPMPGPTPSALPSAATGSGSAAPASWVEAVPGGTPVTRVILRRTVSFDFDDPDRYLVEAGKLLVSDIQASNGSVLCGVNDGYVNPSFPSSSEGSAGAPHPTGSAIDPYDHSQPQRTGDGCGVDDQD